MLLRFYKDIKNKKMEHRWFYKTWLSPILTTQHWAGSRHVWKEPGPLPDSTRLTDVGTNTGMPVPGCPPLTIPQFSQLRHTRPAGVRKAPDHHCQREKLPHLKF